MLDSLELARRIRRHAVEMTQLGKSSHVGSILSMTDIIAVLYAGIMRFDAANPRWDARDRFILSKGHAAPLLYACLAESGYFPVADLQTLRKLGSPLEGHPNYRRLAPRLPFV